MLPISLLKGSCVRNESALRSRLPFNKPTNHSWIGRTDLPRFQSTGSVGVFARERPAA